MEKPVIIFGAKELAQDALEIFQSNNIIVYGFLDDDDSLHGTEIHSVPVLGNTDDHGFLKLIGQKCEAFIASDDSKVRRKQVEYLVEVRKAMPTNAIHPTAIISKSASLGHGNLVNTRAIINSGVSIGQHTIIGSGAIIENGAIIGNFVQIGAGTVVNAGVVVEEGAFIGSGAVLVSGITIGKNARIGAGSIVIKDVQKNETVFGNPATGIGK